MPNKRVQKIIIPLAGLSSGEQKARSLYSPFMDALFSKLGEKSLARASHVEPTASLRPEAKTWLISHGQMEPLPQAWWADMSPVNKDGTVLGPFADQDAALAAEEAWLFEHKIPDIVSHPT